MTESASSEQETSKDRAGLLRDIEQQRAHLGETVDALSSKLDVKARASAGTKALVNNAKQTAKEKPGLVIAAAAGIITLVAFVRKVRRG